MSVALTTRYVIGEFELEPGSRRLTRNGKPVHLTRKPFGVLLYLIENRGRLVTRPELLEKFWDGHEVYEETLTKCVGSIRKALCDSTDSPRFIHTHWAEGYRFIGDIQEEGTLPSSLRVFERTRGFSVKIEQDVPDEILVRHAGRTGRSWVRPVAVACAVLAVASAAIGGWYFLDRQRATAQQAVVGRSIAVLPFANLTGNDDDAYLSDGITENLITYLSRDPDMTVAAPGSSFAARDRNLELSNVANLLHVQTLLQGSLQKDDDILRVAVRLVDGASGRVLWTKEFARPSREIFLLQEDVARNAMAAISGEAASRTTPISYGTDDVEAYTSYLKGRHSWHTQTEESLVRAITFFDRAVERDPKFVLAYCGLSDAYNTLGFYFRAPNEVMPKAEEYAAKALAIDSRSADALFSDASVKYWYHRDFVRAYEAVVLAIEVSPNHALARNLHGDYLISVGRLDEGLAEVRKAVELDPLAHFSSCDLGWQYYNAGRFTDSIRQSRQNLETNESCPFDRLWLGQSLAENGDFAGAVDELRPLEKNEPEWVPGIAQRAYLYAISGERQKAIELKKNLRRMSHTQFVDPFAIAVVEAGLGNSDQTFAWLDKALEANSYNLAFFRLDARFEKLRSDRRYADFIQRAGLE